MKIRDVLFLCLAVLIFAGLSLKALAGTDGKVEFNKDVYEVGEKGSVLVKDPTGYDYKAKKDFGQVKTDISGEGTFNVTAKNSPSKAVNDSGTAVTFTPTDPNIGEEELTYKDTCTVAEIKIERFEVGELSLPQGPALLYTLKGYAKPTGLGMINIKVKPLEGSWIPSTLNYNIAPEKFFTGGGFVHVSGDSTAILTEAIVTYAGIPKQAQDTSEELKPPWWWWII